MRVRALNPGAAEADERRMASRLSLLGKFSALSLLAMLALAIAIGTALQERIETRALRDSERLTTIFNNLAVVPNLSRSDLDAPLTPQQQARLDAALARLADARTRLLHAHLFAADGLTVYSDVRDRIGDVADGDEFQRARAGELVSEVERETGDDGEQVATRLEVYVPLRLPGGAEIDGVTEFYLDYGPTAAAIANDTRTLHLLLLGGFSLLWLSLFSIVRGASRKLRHQAMHDALTGLPNRARLYQRAGRTTKSIRAFGGLSALLLIDLDRFKEVNDTLGHDHGDMLLREVADRLEDSLRHGDMLARLGGDEFAVLLADLPDRGAAAELAARLLSALERPFAVRGVTVRLEASVGIALCPDHGTDVGTLVQRADVAMYDAKREQDRIRVYDAGRDPYSPARLQRIGELRDALAENQLVLHYQPKIAVAGGEVTGVEALVRWQHPHHGLLAPAEFLPLAERTGLMGELTRWVVDAALAQARAWQDVGIDVPIAINLAAANILDVALPDVVGERLAHYGVSGGRLTCELSEHTVMADPRRAGEVLDRLRALGVRLSLDDFGTGQSSLSYLKRLPLDEVKIDRGFVAGIVGDDHDALIVRSTIDLARNLGLEVVAEGVEGADVLQRLRTLRCDEAQGFHLSRPLPAEALVEWLRERGPSPAQPV
jgi:diguanylate cyclase (GGDEF)-like protein